MNPEARPLIPSIMLIELVTPVTANMVKGIDTNAGNVSHNLKYPMLVTVAPTISIPASADMDANSNLTQGFMLPVMSSKVPMRNAGREVIIINILSLESVIREPMHRAIKMPTPPHLGVSFMCILCGFGWFAGSRNIPFLLEYMMHMKLVIIDVTTGIK